MKKLHLLVGIFLLSTVMFAQKKYVVNRDFKPTNNFVRISPTSIYQGDVAIYYERLLTEVFSLEAGVGVLLSYYNDEPINQLLGKADKTFDKPKTGFSAFLSPKVYMDDVDEYYFALPIKTRFYPGQITLIDAAISTGKQWVWDNGLVINVSVGIGIGYQHSLDDKTYIFKADQRIHYEQGPGLPILDDEYPDKIRIIVPLSLKIGYKF